MDDDATRMQNLLTAYRAACIDLGAEAIEAEELFAAIRTALALIRDGSPVQAITDPTAPADPHDGAA